MEKLKTKIPTEVKDGDVFTLSSGDYDERETDCVMQALDNFNLSEVISNWQKANTTNNTDKYFSLDLEISGDGVDLVQYLQDENLAKTLTFFDLHDDCLYSENYKFEIENANWSVK